jgi:hypothetical protein
MLAELYGKFQDNYLQAVDRWEYSTPLDLKKKSSMKMRRRTGFNCLMVAQNNGLS